MVLFPIFGALIGMTLLELWVVIQVGHAIGWAPTFGLMVLDALIGSALMRSQGRAVWRQLRQALSEGRAPAREILDGGLVIAGGAFLITPGFVTDVVGALLLAPPTRALARRWIVRRIATRALGAAGGWAFRGPRVRPGPGGAAPGARAPRPGGQPYDVEGDAVEIDREELRR